MFVQHLPYIICDKSVRNDGHSQVDFSEKPKRIWPKILWIIGWKCIACFGFLFKQWQDYYQLFFNQLTRRLNYAKIYQLFWKRSRRKSLYQVEVDNWKVIRKDHPENGGNAHKYYVDFNFCQRLVPQLFGHLGRKCVNRERFMVTIIKVIENSHTIFSSSGFRLRFFSPISQAPIQGNNQNSSRAFLNAKNFFCCSCRPWKINS